MYVDKHVHVNGEQMNTCVFHQVWEREHYYFSEPLICRVLIATLSSQWATSTKYLKWYILTVPLISLEVLQLYTGVLKSSRRWILWKNHAWVSNNLWTKINLFLIQFAQSFNSTLMYIFLSNTLFHLLIFIYSNYLFALWLCSVN